MAIISLDKIVVCFLMVITPMASASQFTVGGSTGWAVPSDQSGMFYNNWASHLRFSIGDSLLFMCNSEKNSVLQVSKHDYENCHTSSPINSFDGSKVVVTLDHSGPYFFISGDEGNCQKKQAMHVVVLADRSDSGKTYTDTPASSAPMKAAGFLSSVGAFLGLALL
ncbi:hypothetical protein ZOSMA_23G00820 [Zostera marina]|uniref:Phytocyanin domain-containing protein n=1 Tax=Zostera marina TaxID=29655 RepID=A0A0K9PJJ8_ZOSMR|nr:hypothetical protein ZOSMA_23G00820 [Zostera marina]